MKMKIGDCIVFSTFKVEPKLSLVQPIGFKSQAGTLEIS